MKLSKQDIDKILRMGYREQDIAQICEAAKSKNTTYKIMGEKDKRITAVQAIEILGREVYLSGLCRSAFHFSSVRAGVNGTQVYFDSSNLFRTNR